MTAERYDFLGVTVDVRSEPDGPVVVAEMLMPEGASPPLHVHDDLDDSFFILDGKMVLRCGTRVWAAGAGDWVQFPSGVPHTFRVIGGPLRALMVHAHDGFLAAVRAIGRPVTGSGTEPGRRPGLGAADLAAALARHGIRTVGSPMEQDEAEQLLAAAGALP